MKLNFKHICFAFATILFVFAGKANAQVDNSFPIRITCGGSVPEAQLNLDPGTYELSLKVLVQSGSFLRGFKTILVPDWHTLNWEFEDIEKDVWVTMTQEFTIENSVVENRFRIHMLEDDIFGVGEGNFYVDDISLTQTSSLSIEVFPNPASSDLNIIAPQGSDIVIYNILGVPVISLNDVSEYFSIPVSNLITGVYVLKIYSDGKVGTKKVIVR